MIADDNFSLNPLSFFGVSGECRRKQVSSKAGRATIIPLSSTSALSGQEEFATVYLSWDDDGLYATVDVLKGFEQAFFPDVQRGDSVELFIDTRDVKTSGFNTRFCHHFFFLPQAVEGHQAGEITRFRTEDSHELCSAQDLKVKCSLSKDEYRMEITIPGHCLHGYDPAQFPRLGFTYRINRFCGDPQDFSVVTSDFSIEQQPSQWASLKLVE